MRFGIIYVLSLVFSISPLAFGASHLDVTGYDELQTRLAVNPGQTFLAFMKNVVKPAQDTYEQVIQDDPATKEKKYSQLQKDLIAKGAGVAVRIDDRNYFFNVGYLDGSDPKNDVRSGRSYGVGPSETESDPSDIAYLKELESFLTSEPEATGDFVEALMKVITNCDPSGWSKLSIAGQGVATDFLAIYSAELTRHLMVDLNPRNHPWEIDLAAATFVSIFDAASGLVMQNGNLVAGSIQLWWAKGSQGSGIGETRRDRIALQKLIAGEEKSLPEFQEISRIIGDDKQGDVIQGVLEYLNSLNGPEKMDHGDSEKLTQLVRKYLVHVQTHSKEIASEAAA